MKARLLVIENDGDVADLLAQELRTLAAEVDQVRDAPHAVSLATERRYALATLDLTLPGLGCAQLCAQLRAAFPGCLLLAVTARPDVVGTLLGVHGGVDDYVLKPFAASEVREKARHLLARPSPWQAPSTRHAANGGISFDAPSRRLLLDGVTVPGISAAELDVVRFLASTPGVAFSAQELAARLWGLHHAPSLRDLGVNFAKLKKRLVRGSRSCLAVTGDGRYLFVDPQSRAQPANHGEQARIHAPA